MNLQVTVLKILVSYPDRLAVVADLNRMWRSSPPAAGVGRAHQATGRAVPGLDIFSDGLVERQNGA